VQMNVVFGGKAVTTECMQSLRDRLSGSVAIPPGCQRDRCSGFLQGLGRRITLRSAVANRFPDEQLAGIDITQPIGQWMRNGLEGADELPELLALTCVSGGKPDCLTPEAGQRRRDQQLPFLDGLSEGSKRVGTGTEDSLRFGAQINFGDGCRG